MPRKEKTNNMKLDDIDRFWMYVNYDDPTGCWLWEGHVDNHGYGFFWMDSKHIKAHRSSYLLFIGDIPDGFDVCHKCDTPGCVRPDHLFAATHYDNMQDMVNKGRNRVVIGHRGPGRHNKEKKVIVPKYSDNKLKPELFWKRVNIKESDECWEWQGSKYHDGYGKVKRMDKVLFSHRLAYEIIFGKIPENKMIVHVCGNHCCCNPNHLLLETVEKACAYRPQRMVDTFRMVEGEGRTKHV